MKKLTYILMWLHARSTLLYCLKRQQMTALSNQAWRDFLKMGRSDKQRNDTAAATHREEIRKMMGEVLNTPGVSEASPNANLCPVYWKGEELACDKLPRMSLVWEICGNYMSSIFASSSLIWISMHPQSLWIQRVVSNSFRHAFLTVTFLSSRYCIRTPVSSPRIGESDSLVSWPLWIWCFSGGGQSRQSSILDSALLKNFRMNRHWSWSMKWLGSIHKLFSTTLAELLLFHIASYPPYDYYHLFFFYLLDNLITSCLEMEEQKICKDFVRVVLLLLLIVLSRSSTFSSWHEPTPFRPPSAFFHNRTHDYYSGWMWD